MTRASASRGTSSFSLVCSRGAAAANWDGSMPLKVKPFRADALFLFQLPQDRPAVPHYRRHAGVNKALQPSDGGPFLVVDVHASAAHNPGRHTREQRRQAADDICFGKEGMHDIGPAPPQYTPEPCQDDRKPHRSPPGRTVFCQPTGQWRFEDGDSVLFQGTRELAFLGERRYADLEPVHLEPWQDLTDVPLGAAKVERTDNHHQPGG